MRNLSLYDLSIKPRTKGLGTTQGQNVALMVTFFSSLGLANFTKAGFLGYAAALILVVVVFFALRRIEQQFPARTSHHYNAWINSKDLYVPGRETENPPQVLFKE